MPSGAASPGSGEADISLGLRGYEEEAIERAVTYDLGERRTVRRRWLAELARVSRPEAVRTESGG